MHVQHSNPHTSTVGHNGHQFEALRDGIFHVPDEVGAELLARPGWTLYRGEAAYEIAPTPPPPPPDPEPPVQPATGARRRGSSST